MVLRSRKHQRPDAGALAGEQYPVESHGNYGPQAALVIVDPENQSTLRDGKAHLILIGFPIPEKIGDQN